MSDEPKAEISLREVYDAVMDMKHELSQTPATVRDHEARIRSLERMIWGAAGIGTVGGATLAQIVSKFLGG